MILGDAGSSWCKIHEVGGGEIRLVPTRTLARQEQRFSWGTGHTARARSDRFENDLISLSRGALELIDEADFTVLDLLVVDGASGRQRLNMVAAGRDMLAVDRVAAALPATGAGGIGALVLASSRGLGQVNIGDIKVNGLQVEGTWVEEN